MATSREDVGKLVEYFVEVCESCCLKVNVDMRKLLMVEIGQGG